MKSENAIIGGEGNGGIIYPELHYGRDSLVGIALFLSLMAEKNMSISDLRDSYPKYTISKNKIQLTPEIDVDKILNEMAVKYAHEEVDTTDGVKIYIGKEWVHLRKSNTEPIIRIYSESKDLDAANNLAHKIIDEINALI
jgi:phosphomannomutase